jgi:methanogenic corrinoid protein MtbC1
MRKLLTDYPDEPIYNMKAVEQQTGIPAATLRAWERRYALMEPKRTPNGYRLYSDRDVALLSFVRTQMHEGLTISRVVAMLEAMHGGGEPIWVEDDEKAVIMRHDSPLPPSDLVQPLFHALIELDDIRADEILEQAFTMYTMPTVYVEIIAPTLVEIGEAWHRGEVFVSIEHFSSSYLRGRLLAILQAHSHLSQMPRIFVGCAPTERHEMGAMIFSVILRQQGYRVVYLGQDVPTDDLIELARREHPAMVCLSASSPTTALLLRNLNEQLSTIQSPTPIFVYGGRAFDNDPDLCRAVEGHYLGSDPRIAAKAVNTMLRPHPASKVG